MKGKINMKKLTKILSLLMALTLLLSFPVAVSAAELEDAPIDESRTGSLTIYKNDMTNAEKDDVWDARPTEKSIFDYWDGVADIQRQLSEPERVREISETMMLPLWNATLPGDRFYRELERGMEAMQAYRAGTFSVFGRDHSLRPLPLLSEAVPPPENKPTERAFLDNAKYLIDSYCQEVFGQDADFADLSHVDLAYGSTSDSLHTVEIFADLSAFRLVYQVDKETVHEISCDSLQELILFLNKTFQIIAVI